MEQLTPILDRAEAVTRHAIEVMVTQSSDTASFALCVPLIEERGELVACIQRVLATESDLAQADRDRVMLISHLGEVLEQNLNRARVNLVQTMVNSQTERAYADCLSSVLSGSTTTRVETI
jgi:hypothetical protein